MIRLAAMAALCAAAITPALADASAPQGGAFLSYAAQDNQAEIELCLLAEKRAESPAVKAFARLMVDDHVEIESRLAALANSEKAKLPEGVGDDGRKTHDKLDPLSGRDFDAAFLKAQIEDHSKDVRRFQGEASDGKDAAIGRFAAETAPILEQHLALAQAVRASMGSK